MELKVWVEGIQRIVCGVTDVTTCQDVVYALAHATGKTGRFTLMERWRNGERLLAPHEHPLKILLKWGEYASDVQFILQRTAFEPKNESGRSETKGTLQGHQRPSQAQQLISGGGGGGAGPALPSQQQQQQQQRLIQKSSGSGGAPQSPLQSRDIKKSLTFSGGHSSHPHPPHSTASEGINPEVGAPSPMIPQGYVPKVSPSIHPPQVPQSEAGGGFSQHHPRHHFHPSNSSSSGGARPPPPPFSINRPPAPPPYELVRGHPPPPPPGGSVRYPFHHSANAFGPYHLQKDWRNPPPPPGNARLSPPSHLPLYRTRPPPRELPPPPYRDPPPPPPPSHPALLKISPSKGQPSGGGGNLIQPPVPSPSSNLDCSQPPVSAHDPERKFQITDIPSVSNSYERELLSPTSQLENSSKGLAVERPSMSLQPPTGSIIPKDENAATKFNNQKHSKVSDKTRKETRNTNFKEDKNHSESPVMSSAMDNSKSGRGMESLSNSPQKNLVNSNTEENHTIQDNSVNDINENESFKTGLMEKAILNKNQSKDGFVNSGDLGSDKSMVQSIIKQLVKNSAKEITTTGYNNNNNHPSTEEVVVDGYYRELVKLVNQQREKISAQQIDLTKYEAEIAFTEGRWKEEESRLAYLRDEIQKLEKAPDKQVDLKQLSQLEEQLKTAKKTEKSAEEDISTIQKKIKSCDEKLNQMNERVRSIEEALHQEEQSQQQKLQETIQEEEQEAMLREIEKLHLAVEQATKQADHTHGISQQLAQEMQEAEARLEEKRREIEALKQAMRDANLEALSMTPPDEAKTLSESRAGNTKTGTNRRMVGSPRQLETAVPTSKNPHGVWV